MRITSQILRSRARGPLQSVEYLDLSDLDVAVIEKLSICPRLQTLILRGNKIYEVSNLESCQQLWNIDLSNNELKSLDGLSKFVAIGTLNLSNNDLAWHELGKIRHLHIINLSLHGNQQLEKDPYYRIHVVDCLPNVWMLDGRVITSGERLQVKHFFHDSALTERPIRHKLSKDWFIPTALKKIEVNGIYGIKATHLMRRFPTTGTHNIETDRRRLQYLAYNIQEDLMIDKKYTKREFQVLKYRKTFLEDVLDARQTDRERCNMLLLLLVASLEFVLPTHLAKETLDTVKLNKIGNVYTMDLFLLPRDVRCLIVCVLLGAVKADKDEREDGGLYDKLYLCLFYTVSELTKLSHATNTKQSAIRSKLNTLYRDYKCLLASEVVQLLCIVPAFFEYIQKDVGVTNLVITATGDNMITDKISIIASSVNQEGGEIRQLYEELSELLLQKVQEQSMNISNKVPKMSHTDEILTSKKALPLKDFSALELAEFHAKGMTSPDKEPPRVLSAKKIAEKNKKKFPHLGDPLLLGPQTLGKIVSLPQPFVALVAMDSVPVANGAMESKLKTNDDHYTYVNMDQLAWDGELKLWKPKGAIGDRLTMHTVEDLQKELERKANVVDRIKRPNSPDWTPPQEPTTPLIYSPRYTPITPPETPRPKSNHSTHRPMSSLLKEKLDLKFEMSGRSMSASGVLERSKQVQPPSPSTSPTPKSNEESEDEDEVVIENPAKTGDQQVDPQPSVSDCLHCALEAAIASDKQGENIESDHQHKDHTIPTDEVKQDSSSTHDKDNDTEKKAVTEPAAEDTEHSPQEVTSEQEHAALPRPVTSYEPLGRNKSKEVHALSVTGSPLQIQVPSGDSMDGKNSAEVTSRSDPSPKMSPPMGTVQTSNTSRQTTPRISQQRPSSGKKVLNARPYSAVDAYKYIVSHPIRPSSDHGYNTSYQRQRTEAWKQSTAKQEEIIKVTVMPCAPHSEGRRKSPPPQRPSSPAAIIRIQSSAQEEPPSRPSSAALHLRAGNDWLAGGRDLYWESMQRRPKSGHIPGWRDGLPESMKRPRSAAARAMRRSRTSTPVTPSSLMYDAMMQGYPSIQESLPELTDLSDYQQLSIPRKRMLGTPQSGHTDFYTAPPHDTVYSNPSCTPLPRSPKLRVISMGCIPESTAEETVAEYLQTLPQQ